MSVEVFRTATPEPPTGSYQPTVTYQHAREAAMSESARKVLITPDPKHPGWWIASGRDVLQHVHRIGSVETQRGTGGVAFHQDFADEVRTALTTAGYRITDTEARTEANTRGPSRHVAGFDHMRYVCDADDLTVLPDNAPGGHWQDESDTCPRCNPLHTDTTASGTRRSRRCARAWRSSPPRRTGPVIPSGRTAHAARPEAAVRPTESEDPQ